MTGGVDYGEQPDRAATKVQPDEIDPSFSQVTFNDGTTETMPTSQAEALPFAAPAVAGDMPAAPYDPAAYGPPGAPAAPAPAEAPYVPPPTPEGFAPVAPIDPSRRPGVVPAGPNVVRGDSFRPEGSLPNSGLNAVGAKVGTGEAQTDMGEIVAPGSSGGFADFGATTSESATSTDTVEDAATMQGRVDDAYDQDAKARHLRDNMAYASKRDSLDSELDARDAQAEALQQQVRQAELEKAEHERIFKAVEETPIDEDAFWNESPGRAAGAWIALALSGFLQGATRGQNPALNQMVQALNHAQDRYVQNQQKSRDGQLRTRERLMGSTENALSTMKLQLSGIMEKRIMLEAQREGLPPPPGLATYLAESQVKRAQEKTNIGNRVAHSATLNSQREQRATPGTGPQTRFDVALRGLGVDPKKHQEAMGSGLGDQVAGAAKVTKIRDALKKIADANGGELPAQSTLSWNQIGLAPFAARWGNGNANEQVNTKQLLTQATLAYMESLKSLKGIDANAERLKFEESINTGVAGSTLGALDSAVARAEDAALATASGFAGGNARRYVDLLKAQQDEPVKSPLTSLKKTGGGPPPTEQETLNQAGGGGSTPPLAPSGQRPTQGPPSAKASEPGQTAPAGSRRGTYVRLKDRPPVGRP